MPFSLSRLESKIFSPGVGTLYSFGSIPLAGSKVGLFVIASGGEGLECMIVFTSCYDYFYGSPGSDSFPYIQHKYHQHITVPYTMFEVEKSDRVKEKYGYWGEEELSYLHHYLIFTDEDCFECIAKSVEFIYDTSEIKKIINQSHQEMLERLEKKWL